MQEIKMHKRKCVKCKKDVEVISRSATKVKCNECKTRNRISSQDADDYVYCRICGKTRKK